MIWTLILVPTLASLAAFFLRPHALRRALLIVAAVAHAAIVARLWATFAVSPVEIASGWVGLDAASLLFLAITSGLFLAASVYAVGYLAREAHHTDDADEPFGSQLPWSNFPEATFTGCMLLFLATMTLVIVSRHLGLMWVAVEATTLASAPLIYFHRQSRSLEATWKYLVICSVGIALALLGNFFLAVATRSAGNAVPLLLPDLLAAATRLQPVWLKAAYLLLLVGYGTKMGLAPLHTWLPDAHSEAPSVISALLSGALLNCAFLTILRAHSLLAAAGLGDFSRDLLVMFGLFSMALAAVFIIGQTDFKRMLAYSSVEHMGILALGVGIGGWAGYGSMLHAVNHSLTKGMLFLLAGNILAVYHTKSTITTRGVLRVLPVSGPLWLAGFLAITGSPPFGPFASELTILKGMLDAGRPLAAAAYLAALAAIFVGMVAIVLRMTYGLPATDPAGPKLGQREPLWSIAPPAALAVAVFVLGVYVPPQLSELLLRAAACVGAQ